MLNLRNLTEKDKEKIEVVIVLIIIVLGILGYLFFFKDSIEKKDEPVEKTTIEKLTAPENALSEEEEQRIEQIRQNFLTAPLENSGKIQVSDEVLQSLTAPE